MPVRLGILYYERQLLELELSYSSALLRLRRGGLPTGVTSSIPRPSAMDVRLLIA